MAYAGIVTPMVTPMDREGKPDRKGTEKLVEFLISSGVDGLFPMGSTGLFPWFGREERKKFIGWCAELSGGRPVYAGIGSSSSSEAVELARDAIDAGATALVLMPSYYITLDQKEIYNHFSYVISKVDADFILYNIPQLAGSWILPETVQKIREEFSQVKGLKESSGDMRFFERIVSMASRDFAVFQGQDDLLLASLSLGASGGVVGLSNFTTYCTELYSLFREGKYQEARKVQVEKVNRVMQAVNSVTFPIGYYYATYRKLGIDGGFRQPMYMPDEAARRAIDSVVL